MGEHAAPYNQPIEGFANPVIGTAINNITNASNDSLAAAQKKFLIDLLQTEKDTADTLMKAAGRFTSLSNKKVLFFRDSYTRNLLPYFTQHFKESYYYWQDYDQKIVDSLRPDVVVVSKVERYF